MSFTTLDIDDFYFLIGLLVSSGYDLDFDYMSFYNDNHDDYLIKVKVV